jgi:hypothetical protein
MMLVWAEDATPKDEARIDKINDLDTLPNYIVPA